ncbi:MAG: ABC transporter permease [Halioglobus sp.]
MFGALRYTVVKEFIVLFRDPASRAMILGMPVIQLLVFSLAATMEVHNVSVAVVNEDGGRWSREFVQRVEASSFVDKVIYLPSLHSVEQLIDTRNVLLAIDIQADFSRDVAAGNPASIQVLVDGRRANAGQVALSYLQTIASELQFELLAQRTDIAPPEVQLRNWFNPNLEYRWFIVPALVATLAFLPAMSISILSVARDRELGTLDQLVVSPVSIVGIILGKALPPVLAGMISSSIVFLLAVFAFQVPFTGNVLMLFLAILVFVFSCSGIGLAISAGCNTQQQALMSLFTFTVPLFITSGFITPVENMPEALQHFSQINPLKHILIIVHGCFLQAMTAAEVWHHLWPMILIGTFTVSVASAVLRWRIQ